LVFLKKGVGLGVLLVLVSRDEVAIGRDIEPSRIT
jgi:hypothetical protein